MRTATLLLALSLAACNAIHSPTAPRAEDYFAVLHTTDGAVSLHVVSDIALDDHMRQSIAKGVTRGYNRYLSCHEWLPNATSVLVHVKEAFDDSKYGAYYPDSDTITLARVSFLEGKPYVNRAWEIPDHEVADHRLPYLAGDPLWSSYGHSSDPNCWTGSMSDYALNLLED